MKIIILSLNKYKEKDSIINAISEEGYLTFTAHGILSPTSKNAAINNILTVTDVTLTESKSHKLSLKESSVILSPLISSTSLEYMATLSALAEATNKMLIDEEKHLAYPYLYKAIVSLRNKEQPFFILITYLSKLLKLAGYSLEINRCVRCGKKDNIVGFSFIEGGFICSSCLEEEDQIDLIGEQSLLFRLLAGNSDFTYQNIPYDENNIKVILTKLNQFIIDACGVYLDSTKIVL